MTLINGINITNGSTVAGFTEIILSIINTSNFLWLPLPILIFIPCWTYLVFLEKTSVWAAGYFIGNNEKATCAYGINAKKVLIWVYIISSVLYSQPF